MNWVWLGWMELHRWQRWLLGMGIGGAIALCFSAMLCLASSNQLGFISIFQHIFPVSIAQASSSISISPSISTSPLSPTSSPDHKAIAFPSELRGVWLTNIDSSVLFSPAEVSHGLKRLANLNFNTLYPTVWNWGYTLYPSAIAQAVIGEAIDPHPGVQGRDPLQELVNQAHDLGLTVMPWFEFGLMAPSYSELVRRHPDWVSQRQDGTSVVMQGRHPRRWLNPLQPEVQDLLIGIITEVVQNYDVEGIQLDDHFGMPVELGYDPYTVASYRSAHNGQSPPTDINDPEWVQWRANNVTQLMARIVNAVHQVKPDCHISLSPNPQPFAREKFLQDWEEWQRLDFIDDLIIQVYRGSVESFVNELERPRLQALKGKLPISIGILSGLRNQPADNNLIAQQVEAARDRAFSGVSFFFYESLGNRDDFFHSLFPTPTE